MINHDAMLKNLDDAQKVERDNREHVKEAGLFLSKRDGQWEQEQIERTRNRPRYQFDMTNPMVKQVTGALKRAEFGIQVDALDDGEDETADIYQGVIRAIEARSQATATFNRAKDRLVEGGLAGWRVNHRYTEHGFDQELVIEEIANFEERVWLGYHQKPDASDCEEGWLLTGMSQAKFKKMYPRRDPGASVSNDTQSWSAYWNKPDVVMVGDYFWLESESVDVAELSNGQTVEINEDFEKVRDDLEAVGVTIKRKRSITQKYCCVRRFDSNGWIGNKKKTAFKWIPIIPCYANFRIVENKIVYWGLVEKMMDPQRVYNYAKSREIEEGALSPKEKIMATSDQIAGYEEEWANANNSHKSVLPYNHVEGHQPPFKLMGAKINEGLTMLGNTMREAMSWVSGMFGANQGDVPDFAQSGVAIEKLQERGDVGTIDYFEAMECSLAHTGRILVDAIPAIYDTERDIATMGEDGSRDTVTINQRVFDAQTMSIQVLNDLSKGSYSVTCTSGPSFKNKQQATVATIMELGQVVPGLIELNADTLIRSTDAPGSDDMADRVRMQLFEAGKIPIDQMTDEEKQKAMQKAQQEQQSGQGSAEQMIGQAEMLKGQADLMDAQTKQMDSETNRFDAETKRHKVMVEAQEAGVDIQKKQAETERTQVESMISVEKLRQMPMEQVMKLMQGSVR